MRLRTFGRLRFEGVDFSRPKPLLLLTYLALEGPQERRSVAELFWPIAHDSMNSLTVALARLRKGAPGSIEGDDDRIWTKVGTDAGAFLALLEQRDLEGALDVYQDPFLAGAYDRYWSVELEEWVYMTREFLAGHARSARLELAEREARAARFEQAARHAEQAFRLVGGVAEPEELRRLHTLMLAGESLQAPRVRREAEEFGLSLAATSEIARDRLREMLGTATPAAPHNLPVRMTGFVGRDLDLTEVATWLVRSDCRLLTLVGTAGVGKTRLALQVAQDQLVLGSFPDGVFSVSLEYVAAPHGLPLAIAGALGVTVHQPESLVGQLAASLGDKHTLLVLDNFEHLMDGAAMITQLIEACPRLTLLVTSRERLNLEAERIYRVAGLPFPADDVLSPEQVQRFDAVRFFVRRAKIARPDFELGDDAMADVLRICRLVEGLPLGLELAASWLKVMSSGDIAHELEHGLDMLSTSSREPVERHRSMRAAFEHSWKLLAEREKEVLRRLSCFHGGFRREAASYVAGATIAVLASLVDKSLLRVDATGRFDRHPLLYQYTQEKFLERPEVAKASRDAHASYHLRWLDGWDERIRTGEQRQALSVIDEELANLRAAWTWATSEGRTDDLLHAIAPLAWFFKIRGRRNEGIDFLGRAVRIGSDGDPASRAVLGSVFMAQARLHQDLGHYDEATRLARRGLTMLDHTQDLEGTIQGLDTLGRVAWRSGNPAEAKVYWEKALDVARTAGDDRKVANLLGDVAMIEQELGAFAEAEHTYREALAKSREYGNHLHVTRNLNNLGELFFVTGRPEQARTSWREGLALAQDTGFQGIVPHFTLNLGSAAVEEGDVRQADAMYQLALRQARESGDQALQAVALARLGRLAMTRGAQAAAERLFERALRLAWAIRDMPAILCSLVCLAELRAEQGELESAMGLLSLALRDPATSPFDQRRIKTLLTYLRERMSAVALAEAMEGSRVMQLSDVVQDALRQSAPSG